MTVITTKTNITAVDLDCGHRAHLADRFIKDRRRDHKTFYCTVCGCALHWPDKSDMELLRSRLVRTKDMLDTARADRDLKEHQRRGEKAAKTRIKNRIANGVCPCCRRSFQNLHRHMLNKHPDYASA